jgi:hypothetical protein
MDGWMDGWMDGSMDKSIGSKVHFVNPCCIPDTTRDPENQGEFETSLSQGASRRLLEKS